METHTHTHTSPMKFVCFLAHFQKKDGPTSWKKFQPSIFLDQQKGNKLSQAPVKSMVMKTPPEDDENSFKKNLVKKKSKMRTPFFVKCLCNFMSLKNGSVYYIYTS